MPYGLDASSKETLNIGGGALVAARVYCVVKAAGRAKDNTEIIEPARDTLGP
jgi:hypothetical protein